MYASIQRLSNLSITSPTSQLILYSFRRFTYVIAHSSTLPLLHLYYSSFSNPSVAYLRHSSFSNPSVEYLRRSSFLNPSVALPTSQLILQLFRCFTYITAHSPTFLSLLLRHRLSLTSPGEPPMILCWCFCLCLCRPIFLYLWAWVYACASVCLYVCSCVFVSPLPSY